MCTNTTADTYDNVWTNIRDSRPKEYISWDTLVLDISIWHYRVFLDSIAFNTYTTLYLLLGKINFSKIVVSTDRRNATSKHDALVGKYTVLHTTLNLIFSSLLFNSTKFFQN